MLNKSFRKQSLQKLVINGSYKTKATKTLFSKTIPKEFTNYCKQTQKSKIIQIKSKLAKQSLVKQQSKPRLKLITESIKNPKDVTIKIVKQYSLQPLKNIRSKSMKSSYVQKNQIRSNNPLYCQSQTQKVTQQYIKDATNFDKAQFKGIANQLSTYIQQSLKQTKINLNQDIRKPLQNIFISNEIEPKSLQFYYLELQKFNKQFLTEKIMISKEKLALSNSIFCICILPTVTEQLQKVKYNISSLRDQNIQLQQMITQKKQQLLLCTASLEQKQKQTAQIIQKYQFFHWQIQNAEIKYQSLAQEIVKKQYILKKVDEKSNQILNFVEQQEEKKILHLVSQAYKNIESEIYDYATYLQCNSMASSLIWQPKPFRAVQKWVFEQMERVKKFVFCKAESAEDKVVKMSDFISNTMRKFKSKDEQMIKITDFKTECIQKFIKMMQKWLQNWELKQEYLVNLRRQFCIYSQEIHFLLKELLQKLKSEADSNEDTLTKMQRVVYLWNRVETNYKYGNSFY